MTAPREAEPVPLPPATPKASPPRTAGTTRQGSYRNSMSAARPLPDRHQTIRSHGLCRRSMCWSCFPGCPSLFTCGPRNRIPPISRSQTAMAATPKSRGFSKWTRSGLRGGSQTHGRQTATPNPAGIPEQALRAHGIRPSGDPLDPPVPAWGNSPRRATRQPVGSKHPAMLRSPQPSRVKSCCS